MSKTIIKAYSDAAGTAISTFNAKWQKKSYTGADIIGTTGVITALTFNNLVVGKTYNVTYSLPVQIGSNQTVVIEIKNGSTILTTINNFVASGGVATDFVNTPKLTFVATDTTLSVDVTTNQGRINVNTSANNVFSYLTELVGYTETTDFT